MTVDRNKPHWKWRGAGYSPPRPLGLRLARRVAIVDAAVDSIDQRLLVVAYDYLDNRYRLFDDRSLQEFAELVSHCSGVIVWGGSSAGPLYVGDIHLEDVLDLEAELYESVRAKTSDEVPRTVFKLGRVHRSHFGYSRLGGPSPADALLTRVWHIRQLCDVLLQGGMLRDPRFDAPADAWMRVPMEINGKSLV